MKLLPFQSIMLIVRGQCVPNVYPHVMLEPRPSPWPRAHRRYDTMTSQAIITDLAAMRQWRFPYILAKLVLPRIKSTHTSFQLYSVPFEL